MSRKGRPLQATERQMLLKTIAFFEEEQRKKSLLTPYNARDVVALKTMAMHKAKNDPASQDIDKPDSPFELTAVELELLERDKKYQEILKPYGNVMKQVAAATGVSQNALRKIRQEARDLCPDPSTSLADVRLPSPPPHKKARVTKKLAIDNLMICNLRNIVDRIYNEKKQMPSLSMILAEAKKFGFPGQKQTLYKILKEKLGYKFLKYKYYIQQLILKPEIAAWRARYLRRMRDNDLLGDIKRPVIFIDEMWIHGHDNDKEPICLTECCTKKKKKNGYSWMVVHAGGQDGFLEGAEIVYKCKNSLGDSDLDADIVARYLEETVFPKMPANSMLVLDDAPYHRRQVDRPPPAVATRDQMTTWLKEHAVPYDDELTKRELYYLICRSRHKKYEIDELAKRFGHEVVRLPPNHCDLNAIVYVWRVMKRRLAEIVVSEPERDIKQSIEAAIASVTAADWRKEVERVDQLRCQYWTQDELKDESERTLLLAGGANVEGASSDDDDVMEQDLSDCDADSDRADADADDDQYDHEDDKALIDISMTGIGC